MALRVRFAPSPTGLLHIGGARTALFNFLFARRYGGEFLLRLEDTDKIRSKAEYAKAIQEDLLWLKLQWDKDVVIQSQRLPRYREVIKKLEEKGKIYPCFCSKETLEKEKAQSIEKKIPYRYSGKCRHLTSQEVKKKKSSLPYAYRLKAERRTCEIHDLIKGAVSFPPEAQDDIILVRSDGTPVYHFTVVVDDLDMGITHIIRGEDHLSNTPKQVQIYEALEHPLPHYAHIPMIVDEHGKRLSKRLGSLSIRHFREKGFLPEAVINFLARLGWAYDDRQEIFSLQELIEKFSLESVSSSPASFQEEKAFWLNQHYIQNLPEETMIAKISEHYQNRYPPELLKKSLPLLRPRIKLLSEASFFLEPLLVPPEKYESPLPEGFEQHLATLEKALPALSFTKENLEAYFKNYCQEKKIKLKDILQPLRILLTGKKVSLPLLETMVILGQEEVLKRLRAYQVTFST